MGVRLFEMHIGCALAHRVFDGVQLRPIPRLRLVRLSAPYGLNGE